MPKGANLRQGVRSRLRISRVSNVINNFRARYDLDIGMLGGSMGDEEIGQHDRSIVGMLPMSVESAMNGIVLMK